MKNTVAVTGESTFVPRKREKKTRAWYTVDMFSNGESLGWVETNEHGVTLYDKGCRKITVSLGWKEAKRRLLNAE